MLLLVTLLGLQATAPAQTPTAALAAVAPIAVTPITTSLGAIPADPVGTVAAGNIFFDVADDGEDLRPAFGDGIDTIDGDDGTLQAASRSVKKRKTVKKPVRRTPATKKVVKSTATPLEVGLAGAAGAAIGAGVGTAGIVTAGLFATQLTGEQPVEVVLATGAIAIGIAVAMPFMAGFGGGAGVLLADDRARPDEWSGLLQCASSGYCAGLGAVAGGLLGGGVGCAPQGCLSMPGPDRPAEWTAGAAIAGLVAGGLIGIVGGYTLAPDKTDPVIPMGIGTLGGALLGTAAAAGAAGALATTFRP